MIPEVTLRKGREKSVLARHPWVFSGAIDRYDDAATDGDVVSLLDHRGKFLATGLLNRKSKITLRLLSWNREEVIDDEWWASRIHEAAEARRPLADAPDTDAYRVIHSESDRLPGLIVDRYADTLVVQFSSLGMEARRDLVLDALEEALSPACVWHRGDPDLREKEGLSLADGLLRGTAPPEFVVIHEHGLEFEVDVRTGHKTGFYLDQRENRRRLQPYLAGRNLLNCFSYSGAFAVYARAAGAARVINVDSSADALVLARRNLEANGFSTEPDDCVEANVFELLRELRDRGRSFGAVILDPPKFAFRRGQVASALRGYNDINRLALKLLEPGGVLATFSCSGAISPEDFQGMLYRAALDAGRHIQILEQFRQGLDHPEALTVPESRYLTGFLLRSS